MKTIILIRHAKSDWSIPGLKDIDRPLNGRGYSDAHKIGMLLRNKFTSKKLFISSPAIRAISTALIFAREINYPQENILVHPELYEAEEGAYENIILSMDDEYDVIFIFGHNPTISEVIGRLSNTHIGELPTCSVSVLNFEINRWSKTHTSTSTMEMQLFPKLLIE